jgi:hypothetical protein
MRFGWQAVIHPPFFSKIKASPIAEGARTAYLLAQRDK